MDKYKEELISLEVIKTLKGRFDTFPEDELNNRNAPFHKAFLNAFSLKIEDYVKSVPIFISLSSWAHGLSTTLGQSFFENVAHILSNGEKKKFKEKHFTLTQQTAIHNIITILSNGTAKPDLERENKLLFTSDISETVDSTDFTVDNYFEDSDSIIAIELKTVKPNKGIFKEEKTKILTAKSVLFKEYPSKKIEYFIGFPFDPLSKDPVGSNKEDFMNYSINFTKYFDPKEVLLASELWNFLSGEENTMEKIIEIINNISTTEFINNFNFLNDPHNVINQKEIYLKLLDSWGLNRERVIAENILKLKEKVRGKSRLERYLNLSLFDEDGNYKHARTNILINILKDDDNDKLSKSNLFN